MKIIQGCVIRAESTPCSQLPDSTRWHPRPGSHYEGSSEAFTGGAVLLGFYFLKEIKKSRRQLRVFLLWNTSIFILMCVCVKLQWFNFFKCVITYFMKLAVLLCSSVLKQN